MNRATDNLLRGLTIRHEPTTERATVGGLSGLPERIYERVIPGGYAEEHITHLTRDGMVEMVEGLGTTYLGEDFILKAEWVGLFRKHPTS